MPTGLHEPPTRHDDEHRLTSDEVAERAWDWGGQTITTAAGIAAIAGLAVGPEGAAVGAILGGLIGLILAKVPSRNKR